MSTGPGLPDLVVPAAFVEQRAARSGEPGRNWASALPATVEGVLDGWRLRRDPLDLRIRFGDLAVTVPVLTGSGERAVLRVAWPDGAAEAATRALTAWGGRGAVALLDADPGAGVLLLERLDPDRSLHVLPLQHACEVAGRLLRRLSIDPPAGIVTSAEVAAATARSLADRDSRLGGPVPGRILDAALAAAEAASRADEHLLVHADLHYGNVLAGAREPWLAIDPRPVAGDPELGVAELLWTRYADLDESADGLRLLAQIVRAGQLNPVRAQRVGARTRRGLLAVGSRERAHHRPTSMRAPRRRARGCGTVRPRPAASGSIACASPAGASTTHGVPDDSSMSDAALACRTAGRWRLGLLVVLMTGGTGAAVAALRPVRQTRAGVTPGAA